MLSLPSDSFLVKLTRGSLVWQVGAMIFLPCFAVIEQVTIAMGSLLLFQDFRLFNTSSAAFFGLGNLISLIAVIAFAAFRLRDQGEQRALLSGKKLHPDVTVQSRSGLCFGC